MLAAVCPWILQQCRSCRDAGGCCRNAAVTVGCRGPCRIGLTAVPRLSQAAVVSWILQQCRSCRDAGGSCRNAAVTVGCRGHCRMPIPRLPWCYRNAAVTVGCRGVVDHYRMLRSLGCRAGSRVSRDAVVSWILQGDPLAAVLAAECVPGCRGVVATLTIPGACRFLPDAAGWGGAS